MRPYRLARPTFDNAYSLLEPAERARVKQIIADVRHDPAPDDVHKILIPYLGSMYAKAIDDQGYWVLYYEQDGVVNCVSCGRGSEYIDPLVDLTLG